MKRIGIAGMQLVDVSFGGGHNVENKIEFASPEWLDAVRHAALEADRLGMEMAIFSSVGWSLTGGPWVKPEQAMKKLVWSETVVEGPRSFSGVLAQPPSNNGPIRNLQRGGRNAQSDPRVHRWEEKAGFSFLFEYESVPTFALPDAAAIRRSEIIDLTSKMDRNGRLRWDVPPGQWTILRMGYSLTGAKNRPATAAGLGYEVDKLSVKYVESYYHGYFDPIANALGPLFGKSLQYVLMDSWEAGMQNWTDEILSEFQKRRGYDPTGYLPVLTGRVVESAEVSDCFLWDFRRTLADMYADYHYGALIELLAKRGVGT
jgi:hypothetical protein